MSKGVRFFLLVFGLTVGIVLAGVVSDATGEDIVQRALFAAIGAGLGTWLPS